jgi:hypothetical protein
LGFSWPVIFKRKVTFKFVNEYESMTQRVLFGKPVFSAMIPGRKYDVIPKNGDILRERFQFENRRLRKPI